MKPKKKDHTSHLNKNELNNSPLEYKKILEQGLKRIQNQALPRNSLLEILEEYVTSLQNSTPADLDTVTNDHIDSTAKEKVKALILLGAQEVLIDENVKIQNELDLANTRYEEVISLITHEFKNLLTTMYGYNRILQKHVDDIKNNDVRDIIISSERINNKLVNIIDGLLKMSLSEKGLLKPNLKLLDFVRDLLKPLEVELKPQLRQKRMKLVKQNIASKVMILADENLIEIVMRNLLENAIKYGQDNTPIEIKLSNKNQKMHVAVKNVGQGIPEQIFTSLFDKFKSAAVGPRMGGTGIGLYNVKKIIELHRGEIDCSTKPGKWAEFSFSLPLHLP